MRLTIADEAQIRDFAAKHREAVGLVIPPEGIAGEGVRHFAGLDAQIAAFEVFCKSYAEMLGGVVAIAHVINHVVELFDWVSGKAAAKKKGQPLELRERILVVLFDAYVHNRGLTELEIQARVGGTDKEVAAACTALSKAELVRKTTKGVLKFKPAK